MLDKAIVDFSVPSICRHDPGVKHFVASRRAVPFPQSVCGARIEVVGIPALRCPLCGEQSYDLTLLVHIESALRHRIERGDVRTLYLFEQLDVDLTTDA